jgi:hypothetical protein
MILSQKTENLIKQVVVFLLILLFTYTAVLKITSHEDFVLKLLKSSIIPTKSVRSLSYAIPGLEILTILLLLFRTLWGLYFSFILMSAFSLYLVLLNRYSNYSGCSCGGMLDALSFKAHLVLNLTYVFLSLTGIIVYSSKIRRPSVPYQLNDAK